MPASRSELSSQDFGLVREPTGIPVVQESRAALMEVPQG